MVKGAWVTLATNDSYSLGALVLAHSLKQVSTQQELAILVTPGVTNSMRARLAEVYNSVKEVNILDSKDKANLKLLQRPELGITFTKLHCWQLTDYEKCVFLDADTLVLQNCDELFEREELSAAPDVGWPDCFNSGVFVYRPSEETYNNLIQFALDKGSFDGGDQGLLNSYFSDWAHKDISKHLPFIYNVCSTAFYSYLPAFKQFGKDVKIIHFIGNAKPWLQYFDTESRTVRPSGDLGHLQPILQKWWNIFCSMIHPNLSPDMSGLAGAFARLTLGQQRTPEQEALEDCLRRQNWEQGNIDYLGRDSFDNIWSKICETIAKGPQEFEESPAQIASQVETPSAPKEDVLVLSKEVPVSTDLKTQETSTPTSISPDIITPAVPEKIPTPEPLPSSDALPKSLEQNPPAEVIASTAQVTLPSEIVPPKEEAKPLEAENSKPACVSEETPKTATVPVSEPEIVSCPLPPAPIPTESSVAQQETLPKDVTPSPIVPQEPQQTKTADITKTVPLSSSETSPQIPSSQTKEQFPEKLPQSMPVKECTIEEASTQKDSSKPEQIVSETISKPLEHIPSTVEQTCSLQKAPEPVKPSAPTPEQILPEAVSRPIEKTPAAEEKTCSLERTPVEKVSAPVPPETIQKPLEKIPSTEEQTCSLQKAAVETKPSTPAESKPEQTVAEKKTPEKISSTPEQVCSLEKGPKPAEPSESPKSEQTPPEKVSKPAGIPTVEKTSSIETTQPESSTSPVVQQSKVPSEPIVPQPTPTDETLPPVTAPPRKSGGKKNQGKPKK